ncbi:hypothetical protein A5647_11870 [Mycobacterium sp. 1100029.7]|nr:hypothetical protein A5647_11870 [Mycobacterium sp. 1100029.7]
MGSGRFRELLTAPGPFASVYFEDSDDDGEPTGQLRLKWWSLREELHRQGADETITAAIEHAVLQLRLPIGRGGRAVVAGASGVLVNEYLLRQTSGPIVRVSDLPYLVPILDYGVTQTDYLLVVVDRTGALITSHVDAKRFSEAVDVDAPPGSPLRTAADRVNGLVNGASLRALFVVGDEQSRASLLTALPDAVRKRVTTLPVAARRGGYDFEEIQRAVDSTLLLQRRSAMDTAAAQFTDGLSRRSGLAVEGLAAVCTALRQGTVDTLIVGDLAEATVVADAQLTVVAPTAEALAMQGAAAAKTLRADEALPLLAFTGGASVVRTDVRIAPSDGVGAILRYTP